MKPGKGRKISSLEIGHTRDLAFLGVDRHTLNVEAVSGIGGNLENFIVELFRNAHRAHPEGLGLAAGHAHLHVRRGGRVHLLSLHGVGDHPLARLGDILAHLGVALHLHRHHLLLWVHMARHAPFHLGWHIGALFELGHLGGLFLGNHVFASKVDYEA